MLRELNEVVDYIERHLTEELPPEELARYAGITTPQLQAVFYVLAGQTLAEYIKNRRLSAAAQELQRGGRVTDVAYTPISRWMALPGRSGGGAARCRPKSRPTPPLKPSPKSSLSSP